MDHLGGELRREATVDQTVAHHASQLLDLLVCEDAVPSGRGQAAA